MTVTLQKPTSPPCRPPIAAAPPSKSAAHRLLILAALSAGSSSVLIRCSGTNDDIDATVRCLCALGAVIEKTDCGYAVTPPDLTALPSQEISLHVGESGSTLRFLIPILGALGISAAIRRDGRLPSRPLAPLDAVLRSHGMTLSDDTRDPSVLHVSGHLSAGDYTIDGGVSSQFISGLLFALPLLPAPSVLNITGSISSAPYIALTESALRAFSAQVSPEKGRHTYPIVPTSYRPTDSLTVEGDWSGAAVLLCAGALSGGIHVSGLSRNSAQGDKRILSVLEALGCTASWSEAGVTLLPPQSKIRTPISIHADDIPDLIPAIAVLCCAANGTSVISGCARLRLKESDRLAAITDLIRSLGGAAEEDGDTLTIHGTGRLTGGFCEGVHDHRIVMSAALAALISDAPVTVSDAEAVAKSFPDVFDILSDGGILQVNS